MRKRSFARANDAKIVRSRDAQCNTEESPQKLTSYPREEKATSKGLNHRG